MDSSAARCDFSRSRVRSIRIYANPDSKSAAEAGMAIALFFEVIQTKKQGILP
jgi:hypothetical protein